MKIAFAGTFGIPARYGGFETCVEEVSTRLVKRGHDVFVYCGYKPDSTSNTEYKGVALIHQPYLYAFEIKLLSYPFRALCSTIDILFRDIDIVQYFGTDVALFTILPRLVSKKTVLWLDGFAWDRFSYPKWLRFFLRKTAGLALCLPNASTVDAIFARNWYQQYYHKAPIYIPYGTRIERRVDENVLLKYQLEKEEYVLFVGRLIPEKGVHYLIEAFGKIDTPLKLVIVGDDPFDKKNYVKSLKSRAAKNTQFLGFVFGKDYEELCKGAYLYVTPSKLEGTSPALLAAMGYGNCVLVSDIPGNLEVVGDAGVIFEAGNVGDLCDKLEYLLSNEDIVKAYRRKAVERVKQLYDWDKVTDQLEEIYLSLMRGFKGKSEQETHLSRAQKTENP